MKIKEGFKLRNIAGENVLIMQGKQGVDMTKLISFNKTAEWLWNQLLNKEFTESDIVNLLLEQFEIDELKAKFDAKHWVDQLKSCNVLEL